MGLWDDFTDAVSDGVDAAGDVVSDVVEDVADAAEDFADDVSDTWDDAVGTITEGVQEGGLLGGLVGFVTGVVGGVIGTVGNILDLTFDIVGAVVGGIVGLSGLLVGIGLRITILVLSGGLLKGPAADVGAFFSEYSRKLGGWISDGFNLVGDLVERAFDIGAGLVMSSGVRARCALSKIAAAAGGALDFFVPGGRKPPARGVDRVDHFFVLMLENRSFDHMLGRAPGVDGIDPGRDVNLSGAGVNVYATNGAKLKLAAGPGHEFANVQRQLQGPPANGGFVQDFELTMQEAFGLAFMPEDSAEIMRGFAPERLPVLNTLARQFAVCDKWFSSVPGPTLPNRLFAMAGTSGGLADSPSDASMAWVGTVGGFEFDRGSIFDRIHSKCLEWRVYAGDATPLANTLKGMVSEYVLSAGSAIRALVDLPSDLSKAGDDFPCLTWIEPSYGQWWSTYENGMSQHPLDFVPNGEELIKLVYESLRASPIWEKSAFVVLYDEHGGFYDHVTPPEAEPPGDSRDYESWAADPSARAFKFDRLGFRVPAVVVSPLIPRGTVDNTVFDHTSDLATLVRRFHLEWLTQRSNRANRLDHLFSLEIPRGDAPAVLPAPFRG